MPNGILCAGVALASILAGKALAMKFYVDGELDKVKDEWYQEAMRDADDFASINGNEDEYPTFMIDHGFTEADDEFEITEEELDFFKSDSVPALERAKGQTFSQWEEDLDESMSDLLNSMIGAGVKESIGVLDIVFGILGIVTAFKVGAGMGEEIE